jgi:hypothetical protein
MSAPGSPLLPQPDSAHGTLHGRLSREAAARTLALAHLGPFLLGARGANGGLDVAALLRRR